MFSKKYPTTNKLIKEGKLRFIKGSNITLIARANYFIELQENNEVEIHYSLSFTSWALIAAIPIYAVLRSFNYSLGALLKLLEPIEELTELQDGLKQLIVARFHRESSGGHFRVPEEHEGQSYTLMNMDEVYSRIDNYTRMMKER